MDKQLSFTLTSEQLGLPIDGLSMPFKAVDVSADTVTWSVDQDLDKWYAGAHITHASGQFVAAVKGVGASIGEACDGSQRMLKVMLVADGTENTIIFDTSLGQAKASNIRLSAAAGEVLAPVFFQVLVHGSHWQDNGCGRKFQLQGATISLTAVVANLQAVGNITGTTYQWGAPTGGAQVIGPNNGFSISLALPSAGSVSISVQVVVSTDIETGSASGTLNFAVFSLDEATQAAKACHLQKLATHRFNVFVISGVGAGFTAGGVTYVDPLYDPPPDILREASSILAHPYSTLELSQMRRAAQSIIQAATSVLKHTDIVLSQREAQDRLTRNG